MSFNIEFGNGNLGNCTIKDGLYSNLNEYGRVKNINKNVIEIEDFSSGESSAFKAGVEVMIHVTATNGTDTSFLGFYQLAQIILANGAILTLNAEIPNFDLNFYYVQIISIPEYKNLRLENAILTPPPYDVFKMVGGIFIVKVQEDFTLQNSYIDLTNCGIPFQKALTYRPLTEIELKGETDGSQFARYENYQTADKFLLNSGDGAAFIVAKNFSSDENSRVGNPKTHGRAKCRGAADSPFKPSNITNIGGSSILIAAENFNAPIEILAKYRDSNSPKGRGLCRCYIAANSILPNDDSLYAFDILNDDSRLQSLGVCSFGSGSLGNFVNPQFNLNNYAAVEVAVHNKLYLKNKTLNGITQFQPGAMVILRDNAATFHVSKILEVGANFITVENEFDASQVITIPEFENLTLDNFTTSKLLAVAVSGTLNLGNITISGNFPKFGNVQSFNKFNGLFVMADKVIFNSNSQLKCNTLIAANVIENIDDVVFEGDTFIFN